MEQEREQALEAQEVILGQDQDPVQAEVVPELEETVVQEVLPGEVVQEKVQAAQEVEAVEPVEVAQEEAEVALVPAQEAAAQVEISEQELVQKKNLDFPHIP